jgi:hypothetical protein
MKAKSAVVRRHGGRYFADYDFLVRPVFLMLVLVAAGVLVGIWNAVAAIFLRQRPLRRGPLGTNAVKFFLHIFWPRLFRQAR